MITRFAGLLCVILAWVVAPGAANGSDSAVALQAALVKGVAHARDWLEQKDYKSLAQSAGSLQLIAELTKAKSGDEAWQAAMGNVLAKAGELQAAARGEDAAKCQAAVAALDSAVAAAAKLEPRGEPQTLPKPPAVRVLMLTMDAAQGDAKVALLTGNLDAAKKQAHVLAELSKLVSNSRSAEQWASLAGEFTAAANAAANSSDTDAKVVRQHFRTIAERCEACHENVRTQ